MVGCLEEEIKKEKIPILDTDEVFLTPGIKEEEEIEDTIDKLMKEVIDVNRNEIDLKRTCCELTELRQVLKKMQQFYDADVS